MTRERNDKTGSQRKNDAGHVKRWTGIITTRAEGVGVMGEGPGVENKEDREEARQGDTARKVWVEGSG